MKLMNTSKIALMVMLLGATAELPAMHGEGVAVAVPESGAGAVPHSVPPRLQLDHLPPGLRQHASDFK